MLNRNLILKALNFLRKSLPVSCLLLMLQLNAQTIKVGSGSYTKTFPGVDQAGRNSFPSGTPYIIGNAANKPVPTNDWWSAKVKNDHADNLFNYPFTMKTTTSGLVTTYIPWGVIDNIEPVVVGVSGLNASEANVSDFSDWTLTMDWRNGSHSFTALSGIGMPFIYFTKASADIAQITVNEGSVTIVNEKLILENIRNGADFVVYAPKGSTWTKSGKNYTSTLNGKDYWSMAFLPLSTSNIVTTANSFQKYAYVFPTNTRANWNFDESTSLITTEFKVDVDIKEGIDSSILMGLLPHQWDNLSSSSPQPNGPVYKSIRGDLKMLDGNSFEVENSFHGILPTLPYLNNYSTGFSPAELNDKIATIKNDPLATWTDSYNEGQVMNRLIQTARIAELSQDTSALKIILNTVKNRLENWLSYSAGEVAFLFYYNDDWTTLIGYPAGHGQDGNINDHHFHWGYFIHAASFIEQFEPGWATKWGSMVNYLVRDAASYNRNDNLFPFLRNFSPYAGHCWANGFATFPQGNDQESTSESMQFNSSLIHWGTITNNKAIRDLGIYLYTTEQTAIEEYWMDTHERNFSSTQQYSLVSRVWGNSYDNGTFWTSDIAASYGIEMYPIHGGSFYLGQDTNYVQKLWTEIETNTGILKNKVNPNLWHDIYYQYLSFIDPLKAINLYNSNTSRDLKFGVSDAQTYYWIHAMNVLGKVDATITADYPISSVFWKNGKKIYVAHNYGNASISVTYSDGYVLQVPANSMVTSEDISISGNISSPFSEVYPGGTAQLTVSITGGTPRKISFYQDDIMIGTDSIPPYSLQANNIKVGNHHFYARIYEGEKFAVTNMVNILAGRQLPYNGIPFQIPGTIEPAEYDFFEGGNGNGISYQDSDQSNNGDYRTSEFVDAEDHPNEGKTIGWLAKGEWLEYTVDVKQAGYYNMQFRYASGNANGGGPFTLSLDGESIKTTKSIASTSDWNIWNTTTENNIPLKSGINVLRITFNDGDFNLGKMTFSYDSPLTFSQPIADAGGNKLVVLPQSTTKINASNSINPLGGTLTYKWKQIFGPSVLTFSNNQSVQPTISTLEEGVYLVELNVDNGTHYDKDKIYIVSSINNNVAPTISLQSPLDNSNYLEGQSIPMNVIADDLNDSIKKVTFYANNIKLATDNKYPYSYQWKSTAGAHIVSAVAFDHLGDSSISNLVNIDVTAIASHAVPGRLEAEDYFFQSGIELETTTDVGGGQNIGYLDPGDYADYKINVSQAGRYRVEFRNASEVDLGKLELQRIDSSGSAVSLITKTFGLTGGWQTWTTDNGTLVLPSGLLTLRLSVIQAPFNLNWMDFTLITPSQTGIEELNTIDLIDVYPNPSSGVFNITGDIKNISNINFTVLNVQGQVVLKKGNNNLSQLNELIDLSHLPNGFYSLHIDFEERDLTYKLFKIQLNY